jgi:hypothetical protein
MSAPAPDLEPLNHGLKFCEFGLQGFDTTLNAVALPVRTVNLTRQKLCDAFDDCQPVFQIVQLVG